MVEKLEREQIEPVRAPPGIEHVARDHRVEVETSQRDSRDPQREQIVLRVLRGLLDDAILEKRLSGADFGAVDRRQVPAACPPRASARPAMLVGSAAFFARGFLATTSSTSSSPRPRSPCVRRLARWCASGK